MKEQKKAASDFSGLRERAEKSLKNKLLNSSSQLSEIDALRLIHELEVHQIELEMQNQELLLAKENAEFAAKKYANLYDAAPSGYFTLSKEGKIIGLNLNGSKMLHNLHENLINTRFESFVSDDTKSIFNRFLLKVFKGKSKATCEVTLIINYKLLTYVYLTGILTEKNEECLIIAIDIADRMHAEELLRESEERNRTIILETAMDGFWLLDLHGYLLEVNATYCKMCGYGMEELLLMHISDLEAAETSGETENRIQKILILGEDRFETRHRRKDGSTFDVEISVQYHPASGGRFVAFLHDITQRKKVEVALKVSEEKFRHLVWDMQVGVLLQGSNAEILLCNPKGLELIGLDEDQLLGKTSFDPDWNVIHEDGSPFPGSDHPVPQAIAARHSIRDVIMGVYRPTRGDRVWLLVHADPQLNTNGTVRQVVCTFIDITDRREAEEELKRLNEELEDRVKNRTLELLNANAALQQTEEKYRTVADFTYNWEYWIDAEGHYTYVSPSCERITGYAVEEFLNDIGLIDKIVFDADLEIWEKHKNEEYNQSPGTLNLELDFRIVTKSGNLRWIGHICRRLYVDGKYMGLRASNRDITEKIKAESELLNVTVEVEERIRNRFSRELHDGLSPLLSVTKLYFQWLSETDNVEKEKIITEKGNYYIDRAIQTTREIAFGLSSLILNTSGYVETILNFTQSINETQKLEINFTFNSYARFSYLVEITLFRITTELINNTLKYARATHVEIIFNYIEAKKLINFTYIDDGVGFDLVNSNKTNKGMGLMNIQQRIKSMKGILRIETETGKGMKLEIELPVIESI